MRGRRPRRTHAHACEAHLFGPRVCAGAVGRALGHTSCRGRRGVACVGARRALGHTSCVRACAGAGTHACADAGTRACAPTGAHACEAVISARNSYISRPVGARKSTRNGTVGEWIGSRRRREKIPRVFDGYPNVYLSGPNRPRAYDGARMRGEAVESVAVRGNAIHCAAQHPAVIEECELP